MSDPYSNGVLELAADIPHVGRLDAPDATAHKVSRICGSELTLDVKVDGDGCITDLGLELQACALGQASASAFARGAIGASIDEIQTTRDQLKAMLQDGDDPPLGRFAQLAALAPAAGYRQRHGSILLAFEAGIEALDSLRTDDVGSQKDENSALELSAFKNGGRSAANMIITAVKRLPARAGLLLIGAYKVLVSPVFYSIGVRCRHEPTCSSYGVDAITAQGLWRGGWLTVGRLLRCRPGGTWGVDPPPLAANTSPWWKIWALREPFRQTPDSD